MTLFAECPSPDTRQIMHVCRMSRPRHSANNPCLSSVTSRTLGKDWSFYTQLLVSSPSVQALTLGKHAFFAECHSADTRQRSHFSPRIYRFWPRVRFAECFYLGTRQKASLRDHIFLVFMVRSRITYPTQINITCITHSSQ